MKQAKCGVFCVYLLSLGISFQASSQQHLSVLPSFLWLNNVHLYGYTSFYLLKEGSEEGGDRLDVWHLSSLTSAAAPRDRKGPTVSNAAFRKNKMSSKN
jgi:hypothetical protein